MCYTQLYDIEQEQNGFYNYDRTDKFTKEQKEKIRKANEKLSNRKLKTFWGENIENAAKFGSKASTIACTKKVAQSSILFL